MQYDPIKRSLGTIFNKTPLFRKIFYHLLDILLLRAWYIKREIKKWQKNSPQNSKILDAGAGFGQYVYFLASLNSTYKIQAVDVKEEQVADCNQFFEKIGKKNQVHFEVADLTEFQEQEAFDLIISVDVMEHIAEDVQVFKNFHFSMKKNAMLLISTPSDKGGSDVHSEEEHSFIDEHVRDGYNIADIESKLKSAGFSKVEAKYSYGKSGSLAWKLSMKIPITLLNITKLFFILLPIYYLLVFPFCLLLNNLDLNGEHSEGTGLIVKAWK